MCIYIYIYRMCILIYLYLPIHCINGCYSYFLYYYARTNNRIYAAYIAAVSFLDFILCLCTLKRKNIRYENFIT